MFLKFLIILWNLAKFYKYKPLNYEIYKHFYCFLGSEDNVIQDFKITKVEISEMSEGNLELKIKTSDRENIWNKATIYHTL